MKAGRRSGALCLVRAGNEFLLVHLENSYRRNFRADMPMSAFDPKRTSVIILSSWKLALERKAYVGLAGS
jgi:hypothetical protein